MRSGRTAAKNGLLALRLEGLDFAVGARFSASLGALECGGLLVLRLEGLDFAVGARFSASPGAMPWETSKRGWLSVK